MNMKIRDDYKLIEMLMRHEGFELEEYICTGGYRTVGVGRNIEAKPFSKKILAMMLEDICEYDLNCKVKITKRIAMAMLQEDIEESRVYLSRHRWFTYLDPVRQDVLIDMSFMGIGTLLTFKKMIAALSVGDYDSAAAEMLMSRWSSQVGARSLELADMMRTGAYST